MDEEVRNVGPDRPAAPEPDHTASEPNEATAPAQAAPPPEDGEATDPDDLATRTGTRKLSAGASTVLALIGAALVAAFVYPPWPAPATDSPQFAAPTASPSHAAPAVAPVPPCDRTLDAVGDVFVRAKTNPTAAPVADGAPFADCTMRGTLAVAGNPSGTLRVTYGRSAGIVGLTAEQRARDAVDEQAGSACVEPATPVAGFPYAVRCGDDAPRIHEIVLVADGDVYLSVEVTVRSAVADRTEVRRHLAAAAGAAAAKVHSRVRP
ncbi:hypothetical protein [Longispora fulva]|uniref:DUF3558 domain-containing protein n=1 Tax=Longispora fulva TaxID=619741 RepID=A0A8J7GIH0_9ACTN|nr:hypothetical protein [Longispora fulva]MBG6137317.1 hypothetical protein [Longispora fulva]